MIFAWNLGIRIFERNIHVIAYLSVEIRNLNIFVDHVIRFIA